MLSTPFFHSLSLNPPTTMEELYIRVDKYSTLEDNIRAATQTVMIMSKPVENSKSAKNNKLAENSKPKEKKPPEFGQGQGKNGKRP